MIYVFFIIEYRKRYYFCGAKNISPNFNNTRSFLDYVEKTKITQEKSFDGS